MANFIVAALLLVILGAAARYVIQARKRGVMCIGCPDGGCCHSGEGGCACGHESHCSAATASKKFRSPGSCSGSSGTFL